MNLIVPIIAVLQGPSLPILDGGIGIVGPRNARTPVRIDPIEHQYLMNPGYQPKVGESIGNAKWEAIKTTAPGKFAGDALRGGYVFFKVQSPADQVLLLEARGHSLVYVNGEPRGGDPYDYGYVSLPVELKKGENQLLFVAGRGALSAAFAAPKAPLSLHLADLTTPDAVEGQSENSWAGIVIRNASKMAAEPYEIETRSNKGGKRTTKGWPIGPLTIRKIGAEMALDGGDTYTVTIKQKGKVVDSGEFKIRVRKPDEPYKVTFRSDIDGSIQYYGINPSTTRGSGQALFLSLHGASVEAIGQAEAYAPKRWGHVVAPTNRRPFGFDWEDTGRHDALEVLDLAKQRLETDPSRTYLTGHSMGGHGTWQLGAHFPSQFAAIAPSAGWISFASYGGGAVFVNPNPVEKLLARAMSPSNTLELKYNYAQQGIYVLHGDADDNVPVAQARTMRKELEGFHKDLRWHEQPGAGHWWENSPERGAECVDWPEIFEMFSRRRIPAPNEVVNLDFTTMSPGVSSENHWIKVLQQIRPFERSRVQLKAEPWTRRIVGTTENVKVVDMYFDALQRGGEVIVELDGQKLGPLPNREVGITLYRDGAGKWATGKILPSSQKNPDRYGGFKDVLRNRFVLVFGTSGNTEENRWSYAKARYDAESWYYRANGSTDVVADKDFNAREDIERNVVVYGNNATNKAMSAVSDWPLPVQPNAFGPSMAKYADGTVAVFQIAPRKGSKNGSAAIIGGTGLLGMKLTERVPFLVSGASMPDVLALQPEYLLLGTRKVALAGFFGTDWSVANGEFAATGFGEGSNRD